MKSLFARRVIADKYVLDRALAAGGMGSVWSAWNTALDVPVAIKFMAPSLVASPELIARFEREARAAAQLRSTHVVQIFEHGLDMGQPFIVMELLDGEDLGARMRREGRLAMKDTAEVVLGVCRALRRAHGMGIVHRDLKPANIFLARDDEDDEVVVKVLDFGVVKSLAEAVESGVTRTGELIGTPHYMSPEQARSTRSVDHRSDLWSLAIIAYRALTASLPFPDEDGIGMLLRACSEHAPPPSRFAPDLGPEVDAFFERALALDPEERFQSAREMADAMCQLAGLPLSSRAGHRSPLPSLVDAPSSSRLYPSLAYVYTSASTDGLPSSRGRGSLPSLGSLREAPPCPVETLGALGPPLGATHLEVSTRVSGPSWSSDDRADRRAPIAIVKGGAADPDAPTEGETRPSRRESTRAVVADAPPPSAPKPRAAVLAACGALVALAFAVAFAPMNAAHDGRATTTNAHLTWTTSLGVDHARTAPEPAPSAVPEIAPAPRPSAEDPKAPAPEPMPLASTPVTAVPMKATANPPARKPAPRPLTPPRAPAPKRSAPARSPSEPPLHKVSSTR
ncbi:MAG: protein kinase [Polyangiaceae bacterium]